MSKAWSRAEAEGEARKFLEELFQDAPGDEAMIVEWAKGSGSVWCPTVDEAAKASARLAESRDVYFGCSLQDPEKAMRIATVRARERCTNAPIDLKSIRGSVDSAVAIGGVWLDVDVGGEGHKAKDYPPTIEDAFRVLDESIPSPRTFVVGSGGGLHCWWMFKEVWRFDDDDERARAAKLIRGMQETIRARFHDHGWKLDSTHDLARVLRTPGTLNRKLPEVRKCRVLVATQDARYSADDLEVFAAEVPEETSQAKAVTEIASSLTYSPDASPPAEAFSVFLQDKKFRDTWENDRSDLKDKSPSAYEYALMTWLMHRGASEQVIVDVCIAFRRTHKMEPKELRYYVHSLANARKSVGRTAADTRLIERANEMEATGGKFTGTDRAAILHDLSERFGVEIVRIEALMVDNPTWHVVLGDGQRIFIGTIEAVRNAQRFTNALAARLFVEFPDFTRAAWKSVSRLILAVSEAVEVGEDSTLGGHAVAHWLSRYLGQNPPVDDADRSARDQAPLRNPHGDVMVSLGHFRRWLFVAEGEDLTRPRLVDMLREAGWERRTVIYTTRFGTRTSRSLWQVPTPVAVAPQAHNEQAPSGPSSIAGGATLGANQAHQAANGALIPGPTPQIGAEGRPAGGGAA